MSVTRLKRKHRKNIARANNETQKIKNLLRTPVLKNVDLDELKSRFGQAAPAAGEKNHPEAAKAEPKQADAAKEESLFDKVSHAASAAADKVKQVASDAVEAVSHTDVVEKAKGVVASATDAVTHTSAFEAVQEAAHNLVEGTKHLLSNDSPEANQATEVNQTGTEGYDAAEAETKPVNSDGQPGEHPKPEIAL